MTQAQRTRRRAASVPAVLFLVSAFVSALASAEAPLVPADLLLHPPLREGDLTLFPVTLSAPREPIGNLLLLDEGLAAGSVAMTETGDPEEEPAAQAPGRQNVQQAQQVQQAEQVQQRASGAQVNKLSVRNDSDLPLLLIAGEMVRGARQDRIIAHDVVIAPRTSVEDLDVFCVESGRWQPESIEFRSAKAVSGAAIRAAAQLDKSQAAVWEKVSRYNAAVGASSETESLNAAYDKPEVRERMDAALTRLGAGLALVPGACGAVVAVGGRIVVADLFTSPDLFSRFRPKLLAAYLMDSISTEPTGAAPPGEEQVRLFLAAMLTAPLSEDWRGGELVVERFETPDARGTRSSWRGRELHVNGY